MATNFSGKLEAFIINQVQHELRRVAAQGRAQTHIRGGQSGIDFEHDEVIGLDQYIDADIACQSGNSLRDKGR